MTIIAFCLLSFISGVAKLFNFVHHRSVVISNASFAKKVILVGMDVVAKSK